MKARLAGVVMIGLGMLGGAPTGNAADMTWPMENQAPFEVELQFYGRDRNVVWPGGERVWYIRPHQLIRPTLSCNNGEYICYGAWRTGDSRTSWGVGRGGTLGCDTCCFNCVDGTVSGHNLLPH